MSADPPDKSDHSAVGLVSAYSRLLASVGPDSPETKEFLEKHRHEEPKLAQLTETARRLNASAQKQQHTRDEELAYLLKLQTRSTKYAVIAACLLLIVVVTQAIAYIRDQRQALYYQHEAFDFGNKMAKPYVDDTIPFLNDDPVSVQSAYDAVEHIAKVWPPTEHPEYWEKELVYIWARSAFSKWIGEDHPPLDPPVEVLDRIAFLETKEVDWERVDFLKGQVQLGRTFAILIGNRVDPDVPNHQDLKRLGKLLLPVYALVINSYKEAIRKNDLRPKRDPGLNDVALQNLSYTHYMLGRIADSPRDQLARFEEARKVGEQLLETAGYRHVNGQEANFPSYLDTLGATYGELVKLYDRMDEPGRTEKLEQVTCKALALYTAIKFNYDHADFQRDQPSKKSYTRSESDNKERLKQLLPIARKLKLACDPEPN